MKAVHLGSSTQPARSFLGRPTRGIPGGRDGGAAAGDGAVVGASA